MLEILPMYPGNSVRLLYQNPWYIAGHLIHPYSFIEKAMGVCWNTCGVITYTDFAIAD